ncbi:MAG: WG repeat-containing protein, partial [Saprospiraceae bacterium]|nr:WG repeat-containing protein [Saprospiraceae bacterium]
QQNWTILNMRGDSVGVLDFNETKYLGSFALGTKNGQKFLLNKDLDTVDGPFKNLNYNWPLQVIIGQKNDSTCFYLKDNEAPKCFFGPGWTVISGNLGTDELILYSNSFERRYYLLKRNGEFILSDPYEKIHPLNINASYFIQDEFQTGVYDLVKGWVVPLKERYRCYYTGHPTKPNSYNVKYNEGEEEYLYTDNYEKVRTNKKYEFETSRGDAEDPAYHKFTSPKGDKFYFAKDYNAELNYAGGFPYFQVRKDRNLYFYKTDASPLIPEGFWAPSNGEKMGNGNLAAFEVRNDNQIGVINQDGKWIIGPLPLSRSGVYRTSMENNAFIVLQKADADELYNLKGEKLSNPNQRNFTFYGKNLIGIKEGSSRVDTRMYLYTTQMEKAFPEAISIISNQDDTSFIARLTDNKEAPLWVLDEKGKKRLELPFENASFTKNDAGRMIVSQNRLEGVVDSTGKVLVPCTYKKIRQSHPFFLMETEDRLDILTLENQVKQTTLPVGVHYITRDQTYASFRKNDQAYTLDYAGNLISTLQGNIRELKEGHPLRDICYQITGQGRGTIYVLKETGKVFWEE